LNNRLARWNSLPIDKAVSEILPCCGSKAWAQGMVAQRPLADEAAVLAASDEAWHNLTRSGWMEAYRSHPRIGESSPSTQSASIQPPSIQSVQWSSQEQRNVGEADAVVKANLAEGNREYEQRFNRIFVVCATGKSASEILEILRRRLKNDDETELYEAAEQQRQIMQIRLRKWLQG
jgi:2-oxo-4-hydroxy-4-carboxy-5-ureidoimidazoline decarboxylase